MTPSAAPRARNRSWHGESVGGRSLRARSAALSSLSGEIAFAFRAPDTSNQPSIQPSVREPLQSGDYVAALQLDAPPPVRRVRRASPDDKHEDRLVWDLNDLRQELRRLRDLKRALETRRVYRSVATKDAVFHVTRAYFAMFAHGYERGPRAHAHEAFLRAVVDRDVVTCTQLVGADALVEQWRRYAALFELRDYKLRSVHATALDDTPILQIECGYHVFVSPRTLEQLFPHVVGDPYLVQRVVGQKLACDSRVTFVFNAQGKIVRYDDHSDFVAAFARLLRNPRDLAVLMSGALITDESLIGDLDAPGADERGDDS